MSRKITDVIDISGIIIGIGLIAVIGSVIRLVFSPNSILNFYTIGIGIVLLLIGLLMYIKK